MKEYIYWACAVGAGWFAGWSVMSRTPRVSGVFLGLAVMLVVLGEIVNKKVKD